MSMLDWLPGMRDRILVLNPNQLKILEAMERETPYTRHQIAECLMEVGICAFAAAWKEEQLSFNEALRKDPAMMKIGDLLEGWFAKAG